MLHGYALEYVFANIPLKEHRMIHSLGAVPP